MRQDRPGTNLEHATRPFAAELAARGDTPARAILGGGARLLIRSSPANIALEGVADSGVQLPRHRTSTCLTFSLWIVRMLDSEHDEGETVTLVNQAYMACISICVAQPAHSNSLHLQIQPFNTTCTFFCIPPPRMALYYDLNSSPLTALSALTVAAYAAVHVEQPIC